MYINTHIGNSLHEVYDTFWGIDIHDMKIRERIERERLLFVQKIEDLRKLCVQCDIVKPYEEEIEAERIGKMNYFTGQIIKKENDELLQGGMIEGHG
jgi:hypothetical protein